jgi:hypothetical protein
MNKPPQESWCDFEFIVQRKRHDEMEKHCISVMDAGIYICDEVCNGRDMPIRRRLQTAEGRFETELNACGQPISTSRVEEREFGATIIQEESRGAFRTERQTVKAPDGRVISFLEKLYAGIVLRSEAVTFCGADGCPSMTTSNFLDNEGKVVKRDQVRWHAPGKPAISEITAFNQQGCAQSYSKTVHGTDGYPLWQETCYYRENSSNPCKKEVVVFSKKHDKKYVEIAEYGNDGSICKKELTCQPCQDSSPDRTDRR